MKTSHSHLCRALDRGRDLDALVALSDYLKARTEFEGKIDQYCLTLTDSVISGIKSAPGRSLAHLFKAQILNTAYESNEWTYDHRRIPLTPLPDDLEQWSGEQYCSEVSKAVTAALENREALLEAKTRAWKGAVNIPDERIADYYYPRLFDYVCLRATTLLKKWIPSYGFKFPDEATEDTEKFLAADFSAASAAVALLLETYRNWIAADLPYPAPFVNASLHRIKEVVKNDREQVQSNLMDLYKRTADTEWSGDVLIAMFENSSREAPGDDFYAMVVRNIEAFPAFFHIGELKKIRDSLLAPSLEVVCDKTVRPDREVQIDVRFKNLEQGFIDVYRVDNEDDEVCRIPVSNPVATLKVKRPAVAALPYSADSVINYTFPGAGRYILVPSYGAHDVDARKEYSIINCTDIGLFVIDNQLLVVSLKDGSPIEGAEILYRSFYSNQKIALIGKTDAEGLLKTLPPKGGTYYARYGDAVSDDVTNWHYGYSRQTDAATELKGEIYTDLNLYRPGDTLQWSALLFTSSPEEGQSLFVDKEITVNLFDANYNLIEEKSATTDRWGRAHGEFIIPADRLPGNYRVELKADYRGKTEYISSQSVTISDYKLPTFTVETSPALQNSPERGDVTLRIKALTYSGFPVAGAKVTMSLSVRQGFWWFDSEMTDFYTAEGEVDAEGNTSIVVPAAVLETSPFPRGFFVARFSVLSPAGESIEAREAFNRGKSMRLSGSHFQTLCVGPEGKTTLEFEVTDCDGNACVVPIKYIFVKNGEEVLSGVIDSVSHEIDMAKCQSGEYRLYIEPVDTENVDGEIKAFVTVYRSTDTVSPSGSTLWTPAPKRLDTDNRGNVEILMGAAHDTNIYMIVSTPDTVMPLRRLPFAEGMRRLELSIPQGSRQAEVLIFAVAEGRISKETFYLTNRTADQSINLVTEVLRDNCTAGATETWKFRIEGTNGAPVQSAVLLDLYNSALDALTRGLSYNVDIPTLDPLSFQFAVPNWNDSIRESVYKPVNVNTSFLIGDSPESPLELEFQLRRRMHFDSLSLAPMNAADGCEEVMLCASVTNTVEDSAVFDGGEVAQQAPEEQPEEQPKYREAEVALGLFMPSLETDEQGCLTLTVTMPDANSQWRLRGLAYNDKVQWSAIDMLLTTSKPVMVQPNLPRFMRRGDSARFEALVMNNTDEAARVTTIFEIFDPMTGATVATREITENIAAKGSSTASIDLTAPEASMMGIRVRSMLGSFSDGVQTLLPVLETVSPVVESRNFFIAPGTEEFTLEGITAQPGDRLVLEYCDNPVWAVIAALPGVMEGKPTTSIGAARNLCNIIYAERLMREYPAVAADLRRWTSSPDDSTLVSMLERNADLKTMLLQATPWVGDANSDTERMTRLALLLDSDELARIKSQALALLEKLQTGDGGWQWTAGWPHPSEWATEFVLLVLGELGADNPLPTDMQRRALAWYDAQIVEEYNRNPRGNYMNYTYMRGCYRNIPASRKAEEVMSETVQNIIGRWENLDVQMKTIAALILDKHCYASTARKVMDSVTDYSKYLPERGRWWPSLVNNRRYGAYDTGVTSLIIDSYLNLDMPTPAAEAAQWLMLEKRGQEWGSWAATSAVIHSVLQCAGRCGWLKERGGSTVVTDGEHVITSDREWFTADIEPAPSLTIKRPSGASPAYGALMTFATRPTRSIEAAPCSEVSIEKHLFILNPDGTTVEAGEEHPIRVGDRVRTDLLIRVEHAFDYVVITDERAAAFEPADQLPGYLYSENLCFYRVSTDTSAQIFIDRLPVGTYRLSYDMIATMAGEFTSGVAQLQSQYDPAIAAHSGAGTVTVR